MQHIEFFHKEHFEKNYERIAAREPLSNFIDFFWQTNFDALWDKYPVGFSDALFPNIGYTYLINLGTPFVMQLDEKRFDMRGDGFLPRHTSLECFHQPGNRLFGIKFRISPEIFEKKINFAEYNRYIFPLTYLLDERILATIKKASSFAERVNIVSLHYESIVQKHAPSFQRAHIVTQILDECYGKNNFNTPVEHFASRYGVSPRTLQRYFETTTGISGKKALQVMRIRKACAHLAESPGDFVYSLYGYYDHSHFCKHLKKFLQKATVVNITPHLELLKSLHK